MEIMAKTLISAIYVQNILAISIKSISCYVVGIFLPIFQFTYFPELTQISHRSFVSHITTEILKYSSWNIFVILMMMTSMLHKSKFKSIKQNHKVDRPTPKNIYSSGGCRIIYMATIII